MNPIPPRGRSRLYVGVLTSLALIALCTGASAQEARALALHPDNPHYFLFRGKPAVLLGSTEHYGAVLNGDFDFAPYLEELQSKGINLTRTFSGVYREVPGSFNIKDNTLAPRPGSPVAQICSKRMTSGRASCGCSTANVARGWSTWKRCRK